MTCLTTEIEKMKFNPQGLEKYSLVTVRRNVWCNGKLTVYQKKKTNTLNTGLCTNFN